MAFSFETWRELFKKRMRDWKSRMQEAGVNSVYYFISATDWCGIRPFSSV